MGELVTGRWVAKLATRRCVVKSKGGLLLSCGEMCMVKLQEYVWLSLLQGNGWLSWRWVAMAKLQEGWPTCSEMGCSVARERGG